MIQFAVSMIGHLHGGLALAGVVACAMFTLVCGSSVATVVAIGSIVLPEMVKHGYPMRFGAGVITVAGSLGILMLPSIPKVIYAVATGTSIGTLFVAGLLPGIMHLFRNLHRNRSRGRGGGLLVLGIGVHLQGDAAP